MDIRGDVQLAYGQQPVCDYVLDVVRGSWGPGYAYSDRFDWRYDPFGTLVWNEHSEDEQQNWAGPWTSALDVNNDGVPDLIGKMLDPTTRGSVKGSIVLLKVGPFDDSYEMTAHSAQQIAGGEAKRLEKCLDDRRCYEYAERALAFRNAHERKLVEQGKLSADFGNLTMDSFYGVPLINGKNIKPFVFRHRLYIAQRDVRRKTNEFEPPIEWIGVSRLDRIDANELRLADTCYLVVPHSDMED